MKNASRRDVKRATRQPATRKRYTPPKLLKREQLIQVTGGLEIVVT